MSTKVSTSDTARNIDWSLSINSDGTWDREHIQIALLADIRAELRALNQQMRILSCPNFLEIPRTLKRISRNTTKKRKARAVGKPKLRVVR